MDININKVDVLIVGAGIGGIISFNIYNRIITDLFYLNKSREIGESSDYFFIFNPNI